MTEIEDDDYASARLVDQLCDDFECQRRGGEDCCLEDYLLRVPETLRSRLLFELLQIEFSAQWEQGKLLDPEAYVSRFPALRDTIIRAHQEFCIEPTHDSRLPTGHQFGKYQIRGCLGEGAHATVYRALDDVLQREVALKVIHADLTEHLAALLLREARTAAQLKSRGFCQVYETGQADTRQYISMQLIDGKSLKQRMRERKRWEPTEAATLVREIADVLETSHEQGICHRDLKPANILFDPSGEVFITDFGLASRAPIADGEEGPPPSAGSPAYMAPELFSKDVPTVPLALDVFSLGVVFHELLLGKRPKRNELGEVDFESRDLPEQLDAILKKSLATAPKARYTSMRLLSEDLREFLDGEKTRHRYLAVGAVCLTILGVLGIWWQSTGATHPPATEKRENPSTATVPIAEAANDVPGAMQIGVVRQMAGQETLLWQLEASFEKIHPKREMDLSFGNTESRPFVLAGRWDESTRSLPAAIDVLAGNYRWHIGPAFDGRYVDFGREGDLPQAADWNGDGKDELVLMRPRRGYTVDDHDGRWHWIVRDIEHPVPTVDVSFLPAIDDDRPFAGVWSDADLCARPAVARPNISTRTFDWFFHGNETEPGCSFGDIDSIPIVADFDGDGVTDLATVTEGISELVWSFDYDRDGKEDKQHAFGLHGDIPVVGVWNYPQVRVFGENGLQVFPTSVVEFGDKRNVAITISNSGTAPLSLGTAQVIAGSFSIEEDIALRELLPGQNTTLRLSHLAGDSDGVVAFTTNDPNEEDFRFVVHRLGESESQEFVQADTQLIEDAITVDGLNDDAEFGHCIATSEKSLVVGASGFRRAGKKTGAAFAFSLLDESFSLVNQLRPQPEPTDGFGATVDIHGSSIVVGAPQTNGDGYASLFERPAGEKRWRFTKRLTAQQNIGHKFGSSVAIWGDTIAVGSFAGTFRDKKTNLSHAWAGSAHLFRKDIVDAAGWRFVQTLFSPLPQSKERFGFSLDIHRQHLVIGTRPSWNCQQAGTYLFHRQVGGSVPWGQPTRLDSPHSDNADSSSPEPVAIRGPMVAIAGHRNAAEVDAVMMHYRNLLVPDQWLPWPLLSPVDDATYRFGTTLAISDDGLSLLAAATPTTLGQPGRVHLFRRPSQVSSDWKYIREIQPLKHDASAAFGTSLAFLKDMILVGDPELNSVFAFRPARSSN